MAKNKKTATGNEISTVVSLALRTLDESCKERAEFASEVCGRFLRAAAVLPEQAFLGWQINAEPNGTCGTFAFSGAAAKVTPEDLSWIFQTGATAGEAPQDILSDLREESRWVYALSYDAEGDSENERYAISRSLSTFDDAFDDDSDFTVSAGHFRNLFEEIENSGSVLRILGMPGADDARGIILISLPEEMTLRMRTMISQAFPRTAATRVNAADALPDGANRISVGCLAEGFMGLLDTLTSGFLNKSTLNREARLLNALMAEHRGGDVSDEEIELFGEPEEETAFTPIEDLNLSIRAYNCLKRAGVNSVEKLRTMTDNELMHVRNLGRKCMEEVKEKLAETANLSASVPLTAPSYTEMLEELIGLDPVKKQVKKIAAFAKLKRDMAKRDNASLPMVLNMEFTGNPGTAKTTVARILAGIFHEIGILPHGELVEAGRADLIASYEGQTASKVKDLFRRARGKLLFIDEAYSLVESFQGAYGDEAISTIVQEMENHREDTIVIFAGYPHEMEEFFSRNPGLRSRVPFHIDFEDYSADELARIAELEARRRGFSIGSEAKERVASICETASGQSGLGNGRFCRNLVENAILGYASRVYGESDEAAAQDFVLEGKDFSLPEAVENAEKRKNPVTIGFRV